MASDNKVRQEMIEMMYLVLTALLALNVSKEVVAAFITMNNKLYQSGEVIERGTSTLYGTFDRKRAALKAQDGDLTMINFWSEKAADIKRRTSQVAGFILSESNYMIKKTEGKDWIAERDSYGNVSKLKSLMDIKAKTNFDIPSHIFVGSELRKPNERGMAIRDTILAYRDYITHIMGTYKYGGKSYSFIPPEDPSGLQEALKSANPADTSSIANLYKSLSVPATIEVSDAGDVITLPWSSGLFHHTPVVAAAALLQSMKLDIFNNESRAVKFLLSKVDAPTFDFNKIEPLAFARTGYVNAGDSLKLRIMIAAYDSTDVPPIRYGINDSVKEHWQDTVGEIWLETSTPGSYTAEGVIGVRVKGQRKWKPWEFEYTVGKPAGTVSLPEMNVLYRGYNNKVTGAVTGFPNYALSGAGNVSLSKSSDHYIAKPGRGRFASISIAGVAADGSSTSLGSFKFRVRNLPKPSIRLGRIKNGESATSGQFRAALRFFAGYPPEIPLKAKFSVTDWELSVSGAPRPAQGRGSKLNARARRMLTNAQRGAMVSVVASYRGPSGTIRRQSGVYKVK